MADKQQEVSYRKLRNENGIVIPQGIWVFDSPEDWIAAGEQFEAAEELEVVPFIPPPADAEVDWQRESVILVAGGDAFDGPRLVFVTGITRHGNKGLAKVELRPFPGGSGRVLPCEVGVISDKHLKDLDVDWHLM